VEKDLDESVETHQIGQEGVRKPAEVIHASCDFVQPVVDL